MRVARFHLVRCEPRGLLVTPRICFQSSHAGRTDARVHPRSARKYVPTPVTKSAWSVYLARELAGQARIPFASQLAPESAGRVTLRIVPSPAADLSWLERRVHTVIDE